MNYFEYSEFENKKKYFCCKMKTYFNVFTSLIFYCEFELNDKWWIELSITFCSKKKRMLLIGFINIFRTLLFERQMVGVNKERNSCLILFALFLSWILHSELFFTRKGGKRINLHTQHTTEKHVRCFHQMFCHVLRISPFLREKVKKIYCRYGISLGDFDKNHSRNSPERTKPFHAPFFIWIVY